MWSSSSTSKLVPKGDAYVNASANAQSTGTGKQGEGQGGGRMRGAAGQEGGGTLGSATAHGEVCIVPKSQLQYVSIRIPTPCLT